MATIQEKCISDLLGRLYYEIVDDGLNPGPILLAASEKVYTFDQVLLAIAATVYSNEGDQTLPVSADMGAMILWGLIEITKDGE